MEPLTADIVNCRVFTFKDGMLSKIAHDLELRVTKIAFRVGQEKVIATFDTRSLRVLHACKDGVPDPGTLSAKDKKKIESNVTDDVLHASRFPEARFESTSIQRDGESATIEGSLTLHGRTRDLRATAKLSDGTWRAEFSLHQPDYGIQPYKAAFGALKVKPVVKLVISVPDF